MADDPLSGVRQTHPLLVGSTIRRHNEWREMVKRNSGVSEWEDKFFSGGKLFLMHMNMLLLNKDVLARGDQECTALYPVFWDAGSSDVVAEEGSKIKWIGPASESAVAVLSDAFVLVSGNPAVVSILPRSEVKGARRVKVGRLLASSPGIQYIVETDGERGTLVIYFSDMHLKAEREKIRNDVMPG